ncbi:dicarboxylate/amino acid:cation symporter [Clostridium botulinum]|uniref:dicarboxylate/amino acid:cation symporter n=1 Tax=Clostridium botulinum TaxID=1491 RepID=UPI00052CB00D|nr:dicarboxylate/amino acid:cation symporter [Clostridium botulinum]KGM93806.1 sodium:proton antiporter [Clostridium botulinum D str. CCUG 7971]KOC47293.1 sodium:proton antiporter [Clostridium botulinum]NFO97477.1 dicarboxylate/amino acid:cation symporter [Clostridium botulinum]OOV53183.1 sodium:proton antiporter [Clostridium botulinum D/C]OOV57105.1 sodium:proton antiporter [Clostridium botulinum D/C]
MSKNFKLGLIPKIILGIILGIIIGKFTSLNVVRFFVTISSIFGNFLGFVIPIIILGFIIAGIAELGNGAGKLLGITVGIAYLFTLISGFFAYIVGTNVLHFIITPSTSSTMGKAAEDLKPFFNIEMQPIMGVMTALIFSFLLGLGISAVKSDILKQIAVDFQKIVSKVISTIIIPLLPLYILGIFANMTYTGKSSSVLKVFGQVFVIIIICHIIILLFQFALGCIASKQNLFKCLKIQITGYLTALGTQSSAATIPVNVECSKKMGISKGIRQFVIPLCATTHMSGSTITLTLCAMSVMMLNGMPLTLSLFAGFIAMLGVSLVAAPGVPGGCVMAALGVLQSILGFNESMLALMIALYVAQDSFGTACNISGDQSIAMIVDYFNTKLLKNNTHSIEL